MGIKNIKKNGKKEKTDSEKNQHNQKPSDKIKRYTLISSGN